MLSNERQRQVSTPAVVTNDNLKQTEAKATFPIYKEQNNEYLT